MSDDVKVSATLLDITKLHPLVIETVLKEVSNDCEAIQHAVWAVEKDSTLTRQQKKDAVTKLMGKGLNHLRALHNADDSEFGKFVHGAAHQMIDQVNKDLEHEDRSPCKTVVFSFLQMIDLGWRLAGAHLERESLEQLT